MPPQVKSFAFGLTIGAFTATLCFVLWYVSANLSCLQ
jgi:hypothetical protein